MELKVFGRHGGEGGIAVIVHSATSNPLWGSMFGEGADKNVSRLRGGRQGHLGRRRTRAAQPRVCFLMDYGAVFGEWADRARVPTAECGSWGDREAHGAVCIAEGGARGGLRGIALNVGVGG